MDSNDDEILLNYNKIDTLLLPNSIESSIYLQKLRGIKICHMNIRSLRKNIDEFTVFLQSLNAEVDIIVLTEAFIHDNLPNYHIPNFLNVSAQGQLTRNEGVIVYYKKEWNVTVIPHNLRDCTAIFLNLENNNVSIPLLGIYRTPSIHNTETFIQSLEQTLSNTTHMKPVILGDLNINIANNSDLRVENYLNTLASFGYINVINKPTRVTATTSTCIDHIFVPEEIINLAMDIKGVILETAITDHFTQFLVLSNKHPEGNNTNTEKSIPRNKINYTKLNKLLGEESWDDVLKNDNVNESYDIFLLKYTNLIEECSITTNQISSSRNKKLKPWMNQNLINAIRYRDKLLSKSKHSHSIDFKKYVKDYANSVKTMIRNTKNTYFKNKVEEAGKNIRKVWTTINDITNKSQKKDQDIKVIEINGQEIKTELKEDSLKIANHFNTKFLNNAKILQKKITPPQNSHEILESVIYNRNTMSLFPISEVDIEKAINNLKNKNSTGTDSIKTETLKNTKDLIKTPLCHIANIMFKHGEFPDKLKKAIVIPIFKGGNRKDPDHYRAVSILSNVSKIFERLIYEKILSFSDKYKLIENNQYGFKKNSSTNDAIGKLIHSINSAKDKKLLSLCLFLDLSKAFDTIPHELLLKKLNKMGIRGLAEKLIRSYLSNRSQITKVNDSLSDEGKLDVGLPQGTILSPVLFNLYVNDLLRLKLSGEIAAFADDTRLLCSEKNRSVLYKNANEDFESIKNWLAANLLTLNTDKTVFLEFNPKTCENDTAHGITGIKRVEETKFLGVIIDDKLKWDRHVSQITTKLRKTIYKFVQLRQCVNEEVLKTVYYALVQSHLTYGIIAWGGAFQNTLEKLAVIQRKILKVMYKKAYRFPTEEIFKLSGVLNINQLYIKEATIEIYKQKEHLGIQHLTHLHDTRYSTLQPYQQHITKSTYIQRQALYTGLKHYNLLPLDIKKSKNLTVFKKQLNKFIKEKML